MKFAIGLAHGTTTISKPHNMALTKLKELKSQLEELLQIGLILPSIHLGEPMTFLWRRIDHFNYVLTTTNSIRWQSKIDILCWGWRFVWSRFFKIDIVSSYYQLQVKELNIEKTTFWTRYEHYEFLVKPFGLTNSQTLCLDKFIIIFVD